MSKTYAIAGATGKVGQVITENLLAAGQKVRAIGRDANKLQALKEKGADIYAGDLHDASFLNNAYKDADAIFLLIPPNYVAEDLMQHAQSVIDSAVAAVKNNNVKYVVLLSSVGVHNQNTKSVLETLVKMENAFNAIEDVNVLSLRPTYFMENIYFQVPTIQQMGIAGSPVRGDLAFPMIASKDVGVVASKRLLDLSFTGKSYEYLLGQRDVSFNEATKIIGAAIGKPDLNYVTFPYDQAEQAMAQMMSPDMAHRMVQLAADFNDGDGLSDYKRTSENTTPTSIEEFAQWFAVAYNAPQPSH